MTSELGTMNALLIAGLGNPGRDYAGTRHNVGFDVIDALLAKMPRAMREPVHGCDSLYWKGAYANRTLFLQKPQTYMNLSGDAVSLLAKRFGIIPSGVIVVHDDMDLPLGRMRIRRGGSCGGHNGIRSVIEKLGTESFPRVRIGIGHSENGHDGADHVLSAFEGGEKEVYEKVVHAAVEALVVAMRRSFTAAMDLYNGIDYAPEGASEEKQDPNKIIIHQEV